MSGDIRNRKKGSFWTLGRKLTLVISATVILAFAMLMTLQVIGQREGMTTMAEHDFKVMSEMMAQQISGAVRWNKVEAIETLYQDFTKEGATDLSALVVLDGEGASLSAFKLERFAAAGLVESLQELAKGEADEPVVEIVGEHVLIAVPVYPGKNNFRVGTLAVSWSLEEIEKDISRSLMMQLGLGVAILIGLGALMLLLINRMVGRPVGAAADVADKIASGDFSSRIDERKSRDELGVLMEGLKTMQANLKETIEADRRKAAEAGRIKTALDNVSANVMVADADHNIIYVNEALMTMFREAQADIRKKLPRFDADALMGANFDRFHQDPSRQRRLIESLSGTHTAQIEIANRTFRFTANSVVDDQGVRLGTVVEWADRTLELGIENLVQEIVNAAQSGDLSQRLSLEGKDGFLLKLGQGLNALLDVSERVINDTLRVLSAMSQGNLTETISTNYEGSFGRLKHDANATVAKLTEVISRIQSGAVAVSSGAGEISQGTTDLSQRTEEQAANLEETASSMEQMTATVKQNADNARQANQLSSGAREQAEKGGEVVNDAVSAMSEISSASKKIADIIGVIDEIAFQTNLLALNAAVEAARAGEQGRGFAVVASEVRNLAQRSATAAKEIKDLIQDSVSKVEQGSQLVDQSGQTLGEIVTAVKRVSGIIAEIAAASAEQSSGIEEVNKAIMQMDDMTQQNAALVEQSAAAAQSMNEQSNSMKKMMDFFKVDAAAVQAVAGNMTVEGLDTAGIDFSDIRSKHLMWKSRLRRFLDGKESMSKEQAVSHRHCDLGKWLYPAALEKYGYIQEMRELEKVHKHLHEVIRRIVDFKQAGKADQAEREYEQVEPISQQVVSLINAVERHVKLGSGQGSSQATRPPVERRSVHRPWSNAQPKAKEKSNIPPRRPASGGDDADWEEF